MLFNSFSYLVFFVSVWIIFWFVLKNKHKAQQFFLLAVSCYFYMFFIPKYILILFLTILVDYWAGWALERTPQGPKRKWILWVSVGVTCAILLVFKYYNFFAENAVTLAHSLGMDWSVSLLTWALPIGLSFHTFQSLSYVFEVYYGRQKAELNPLTYGLYVMYFPQLVAGPIERPGQLLTQLNKPFVFQPQLASDGVRLLLWGLFKKAVIADSCAQVVNATYLNLDAASTADLWYAAVLFSIQIYGDFSGYSDMARGSSQLMGIKLIHNFRFPYFSLSVSEFWKRWHISLSSWFRDYVYIPLGGNRVGTARRVFNVMVVFVLSGFWHGAAWTYLAWGAINALFILPSVLLPPSTHRFKPLRMVVTFAITSCIWVFFRATSLPHAAQQLWTMLVSFRPGNSIEAAPALWIIVLSFFVMEYNLRFKDHGLDIAHWKPRWRYLTYLVVFALLFVYGIYPANQFIYFQF